MGGGCPDLFGPGAAKREFLIFDYCRNLEFFGENPEMADPAITPPISERLFGARIARLKADAGFGSLQKRIVARAAKREKLTNVLLVAREMALTAEISPVASSIAR